MIVIMGGMGWYGIIGMSLNDADLKEVQGSLE